MGSEFKPSLLHVAADLVLARIHGDLPRRRIRACQQATNELLPESCRCDGSRDSAFSPHPLRVGYAILRRDTQLQLQNAIDRCICLDVFSSKWLETRKDLIETDASATCEDCACECQDDLTSDLVSGLTDIRLTVMLDGHGR